LMDIYRNAQNATRIYYNDDGAGGTLYASTKRTNVTVTISSALSFAAGDEKQIILTLDFGGDMVLYVDGVEAASDDISALADILCLNWDLGTDTDSATHGGFTFSQFAVFGKELSAIEAAQLYNLKRPLVDAGSFDTPGIYIVDGKFKISSSLTGNRIEITADEIAGKDSAGVKQFYLQSSDGKAVAGAGAVIIDVDGITLEQGDATKNYFGWQSGGTIIGQVYTKWVGGAGDKVNTFVAALDDGSGGGAAVIIRADDADAADVRLNVNSNGTINASNATDFLLESGGVNWADFTYGANYILVFGDAAGGDKFQLKDSALGVIFQVDSNGDVLTASGNIEATAGLTLTGTSVTLANAARNVIVVDADGDVEVTLGDAAGAKEFRLVDNGLNEVFAINSDGNINIPSTFRINVGGNSRLTLGADGNLEVEDTIRTSSNVEWNLGNHAAGTIAPDTKIHVQLDGDWFTLCAEAGLH